jgi:hypothetical protein
MTKFLSLFLLTFLLAILGCVHDGCNNVPQRPVTSVDGTTAQAANQAMTTPTPVPSPTPVKLPKDAVQVAKATGEKQCGIEKGVAIEEVQSTLTQDKITVYEAHTQLDGLMHMALCGSPSGSVHVFSIPKKDLAKAKKLGFKSFKSSTLN